VATIDGTGKTLLPGLIDAHTHTYGDALKDALAFGVTTELDMFTDYRYAEQIKKDQAQGRELDLADLRSAGTLVTAPHGHGTEYGMSIPTISSPEEAQDFVDSRIAEGSDYIKIIYDDGRTSGLNLPTISRETMAAVAAAAHKRGRIAIAHIGSLQGAKDAISAGVDGLAHLFEDLPPDPQFISLAAEHNVFVVPTLSVLASRSGVPSGIQLATDYELEPYLSSRSIKSLETTFEHKHGDLKNAELAVRELNAKHVRLLAGTDASNPGTAHGASMHGELRLLVEAGLSTTEALASATSVPATVFHLDDRGRIVVGRRADLLLVEGNPITNITDIDKIVAIWKLGVMDDRDAYRAAISREKSEADTHQQRDTAGRFKSMLISDFEDCTTSTKFGSNWVVSSDQFLGGKSTADLQVVPGGAEGSKCALEVNGDVVQGPISWAGAMFSPNTTLMSPVDLSREKAISFFTKGDGQTYEVMVVSQAKGYAPAARSFVAGPEWKEVIIPFSDFGTDAHDLEAIIFGVQMNPGRFTFLIDTVRLVAD